MKTLNGKGVFVGVAIGKLSFYRREQITVRRIAVSDTDAELARFDAAKRKTLDELHALYVKALGDIGESGAQIFEIHSMMVEDEDYNESVKNIIINEKVNAEYAVASTADNFALMFSSMEDAYMNARAADVKDISNRIVMVLSQKRERVSLDGGDGIIVCADDLAPSETMQLDKDRVIAFVTSHGSVNSHTAILARTMGIPAVVGVGDELMELSDGDNAIVDGSKGVIYIEPDTETLEAMEKKREDDKTARELLEKYKGLDNVTLDGHRIEIYANIQGLGEIGAAIMNDAGGIGLFRSEFLYLGRNDFPSETEQFLTYKKTLQSMAGKKVVIRTLDIGADKQIDYFKLDKEENPALGMRAIRICLTRPEIFRTQLKALLRASVFGNLAIMFPMITSCEEVREIMKTVDSVKNELNSENTEFSEKVEYGIMIETPAAALISDELAEIVDFFSVGTNDLSQYTLAIDRQNQKLAGFFNPHHRAILKLIELAADNAHKCGKWIGICGELGADTDLTETFLRMGIDEISVSPPYVLKMRDKIRNMSLSKL